MIEIVAAMFIGAVIGAGLLAIAITRDDTPVRGIAPGTTVVSR